MDFQWRFGGPRDENHLPRLGARRPTQRYTQVRVFAFACDVPLYDAEAVTSGARGERFREEMLGILPMDLADVNHVVSLVIDKIKSVPTAH